MKEKKKIISNTNIVYTFAQFSGIILSNLIVILFSLIDLNGYRTSLIISALFVLLIIFYIPKDIKNKEIISNEISVKSFFFFIKSNKILTFIFSAYTYISGLYLSIILPLIPLYLKKIYSINEIS